MKGLVLVELTHVGGIKCNWSEIEFNVWQTQLWWNRLVFVTSLMVIEGISVYDSGKI